MDHLRGLKENVTMGRLIPAEFIADFSNVGAEVDVTGPGVGVVSTVRDGDFAVMDGTSMACPAVTGVTARLLGPNRLF